MEGVRTSRNPIDPLRDTEESSISLSRLETIDLVCTETSSVSFSLHVLCPQSCMIEDADKLDLSKPKDEPIRQQPFCLIPASYPASWRRQPIPRRRPKDFALDFLPPTIPMCIVLISIQRNEL